MRILAIDPASRLTGWAFLQDSRLVSVGVWNLQPKRTESMGMRVVWMRKHLGEAIQLHKPELVAFEEVRRHSGTAAAHAYGAIKAAIQEVCEAQEIDYTSVPVADAKKVATGKGNAKKKAVMDAAKARWPQFSEILNDDNAADAAWIGVAISRDLGGA